jgi:hypothetical protein
MPPSLTGGFAPPLLEDDPLEPLLELELRPPDELLLPAGPPLELLPVVEASPPLPLPLLLDAGPPLLLPAGPPLELLELPAVASVSPPDDPPASLSPKPGVVLVEPHAMPRSAQTDTKARLRASMITQSDEGHRLGLSNVDRPAKVFRLRGGATGNVQSTQLGAPHSIQPRSVLRSSAVSCGLPEGGIRQSST